MEQEEDELENPNFNEVYVWGDDSSGQLGLCGLFNDRE